MSRAQFREVNPLLPVRNVSEAIGYYTNKLGFQVQFQDDPHDPQYAGIERDGVHLHMQWHAPEDFPDHDGLMLRFVIDDVDLLFQEYRDKGVFQDHTTLEDTSWGTREFAFYDPDGNGLTFYRDL